MKRLIRKAENKYDYGQSEQEQVQDDFLGQNIEIAYNKSKWFGYTGYVDTKMHGNEYVVYLDVKNYEQDQKPHRIRIDRDDAYKWMNVIQTVDGGEVQQ